MSEPRWLVRARKYIGQKEIPGKRHNPWIVSIWKSLGLPYRDDETPWCAGFQCFVLEAVGIRSPRSASARSFERWGVKLSAPALGCVVVFWRGKRNGWSGHVGTVVGLTPDGNNLLVLGANQRNAVNIMAFDVERVLSYRWPAGEPLPRAWAGLVKSKAELSTNEA